MKPAVTRLFSKSYKKTYPKKKKNLAKKTWGLAKESTFSLLLRTSEDFLISKQETPNSLQLHR